MKDRLKSVSKIGLLLLSFGFIYAVFYEIAGFGIPCPFFTVTGLYCPGCGISRMCMALLHLDFKGAVHYNGAVLLALPVLIAVFAQNLYGYIRWGRVTAGKGQKIVLWILLIYFLVFGVLRNL